MKKIRKILLLGAIFGLIAPFIGLFVGLQVSPALANVLMFPIITISHILNQPFGMTSLPMKLFYMVLSMLFWSAIFYAIAKLITYVKAKAY